MFSVVCSDCYFNNHNLVNVPLFISLFTTFILAALHFLVEMLNKKETANLKPADIHARAHIVKQVGANLLNIKELRSVNRICIYIFSEKI